MDETSKRLVEYALAFPEAELPDAAIEAATNHLVDAIACAIAGYSTPPAEVAVDVARNLGTSGASGATVFGAGLQSLPTHAVFANTIMVRTLDWNDGMLARGGGHPSDMIPAILAAAEATGASGSDVLRSIVLAYEALGSLARNVDRVALGLDQGLFMGAATAISVGMMHGLDADQLANAISLSVVPSVPLHVTRRGTLSMWKGAATAAATMNATNWVMYAKAGMTAPDEPFDGECGLTNLTGPIDLQIPLYPGGKYVVQLSHQKMVPAESHSQAVLGLAPRIVEFASLDEIEEIHIDAYGVLVVAIGSHHTCWDPKTRESADHSLPYLLAVAMTDGRITPASFTPERIADPALRPVMAQIRITENPEFTAGYRPPGMELAGSPKVHVNVRTTSGKTFFEEVTYARGHSLNPMTRDDVNRKLDIVCDGVVDDDRREAIRDAWWNLGAASSVRDAIATIADFGVVRAKGSSR